jgi:hypothetical protein
MARTSAITVHKFSRYSICNLYGWESLANLGSTFTFDNVPLKGYPKDYGKNRYMRANFCFSANVLTLRLYLSILKAKTITIIFIIFNF